MLTKPVRIDVTQEDIAHGVMNDCENCPVARAFIRATGLDPFRIAVDEDGITIAWPFSDREVTIDLPESVGEWISAFDDGLPVWPFAFDLSVPAEALA
jgi:hypothetical protein